jgi:photosystem II stability/assembly factor-like uncharacterized protein
MNPRKLGLRRTGIILVLSSLLCACFDPLAGECLTHCDADEDTAPANVTRLMSHGGVLLAGSTTGQYRSTNYGDSWSLVLGADNNIDGPVSIDVITASGPVFIAGGRANYSQYSGLYRSTDNGKTWDQVMTTYSTAIVAGSAGFRMVSTDGFHVSGDGLAWTWTPGSTTVSEVYSVAAAGDTLYAGLRDNGVYGLYRSLDGGVSWSISGLSGRVVSELMVHGGAIWAGHYGGIFRSRDGGANWDSLGPAASVIALLAYDNTILAGTSTILSDSTTGGLYRSVDGGASWNRVGFAGEFVGSLAMQNGRIFASAGRIASTVYRSENGGTTWKAVNKGMLVTYTPWTFI